MVNFTITKGDDPLHSTELKELRQKLQTTPANDPLKKQIRELDLSLREKYFHHLATMRAGTYLLLAGAVALVISGVQSYRRERALPDATQAIRSNRILAGKARWSVMATGGVVAVLLLVISLGRGKPFPERPEEIEKLLTKGTSGVNEAADFPSAKEIAMNWPRFLGPNGNGYSELASPPTSWNPKTGESIAWKTLIGLPGHNSPVVWNNRLFLSGGDSVQRAIICFDAHGGKILWQKIIAISAATSGGQKTGEIPESTGYAASSMATDGKRIFVIFATGDLAALDFNGEILWSKCLGPLKNMYGHASSLLTWRGRLFAQVDQGESAQGKSRLYAFDCRSGEVLWQQARSVGSSWSSPTLVESAGKMQLVTIAVPRVNAYAADTGAGLWRVEGINGEVTPSPIAATGLVFAISPSEKLIAIRSDGSGDVTKSHVVWSSEDNVPDITSPASDGELLFTISSSGLLTCYDAKDGKKQWEHDFETEFHSSPAIAGKSLYLISLNGKAFVVEVGRQFKEVFRTEMPDAFSASPAFVEHNLYLRGATNLWCIGALSGQLAK